MAKMDGDESPILICSAGTATSSRLERWLTPRYEPLQRCTVVAELVHQFETQPPDLIIVDVSEGQYEFLRVAHRLRQRSNASTVLVAAGEVATDRPLSVIGGADAVIFQPMSETATISHMQLLVQLMHARRDLKEARLQLEALALSRQNGLALLNRDGDILFHNRALATMFGYTAEQLQRAKIWDLTTPAGRKAVRAANYDLQADAHGTAGVVGRWQRRDGQLVDIEIDAHRYFDGDTVGGLIFEASDIADELALRQLLQEQPLANADAAMLMSRLEELKSGIEAIDLLTQEGAPSEALRPHVDATRATLDRVMRSSLPVEDVDLVAVLHGVLDQHARHHEGPDVQVEVDIAESLPLVRGRTGELRRTLANGLADAVAAARGRRPDQLEPGRVRLVARHRPEADGRPERVVVTIEDNGVPADHFARYDNRASFRIDRGRSRLSLWGGGLQAETGPDGIGLLLTIELALAGPRGSGVSEAVPMHHDILLVEDEVHEHQVIGATLQRAGYRVTGVADARAAERVLHERHFDLIIIDANVPEAASKRGISRFRSFAPDVPVVLIGSGEPGVGGDDGEFGGPIVEADGIEDVLDRVEQALR